MNGTRKLSTSVQAGSEVETKAEEIEATRARALLLISADEVCNADLPSLIATQAVLNHGNTLGRWQTPKRWCTTAGRAKLDVDLRTRVVALMPDEALRARAEDSQNRHLLDHAVVELTRYLLILRMGPAGIGRKGRGASLDPGVVADRAYYIASSIFALALTKWMRSEQQSAMESGFLRVLKLEDLDAMSASQRELSLAEFRRMDALYDKGCWNDLPSIGADDASATPVAGAAPSPASAPERDAHLPLPDTYVSEMGQRSIWLIESLAPNLLAIAQRIGDIWAATDDGSVPMAVVARRRQRVPELLESWEWVDAEGRSFDAPPFDIKLSRTGDKRKKTPAPAWPPRTLASVLGLLGNVQLAHLFVVSLSTGGRKSETLDLRRNCVEYGKDGRPYASGRTFKLVRRHDGELRDWVLPDLAVAAIEQQSRLVALVEVIGKQSPTAKATPTATENQPDHLWAQISSGAHSDRTKPLLHLDKAMRAYAKALGMDERPSGQWLRPHRFRKTVARLAALALTQAPKVLMDVFGHKSIEMTLYYILSDKSLQDEIEQVGRELRVMRAAEAIEAIVAAEDAGTNGMKLGGYGGPAALMVDRAIQVHRERAHRRGVEWGANSVRELAEVLTLQGKAWEVVRRGVVCTKLPGSESGPCNKSKGRPEPSHCQTDCSHRLEEAFLREDVDASIASSVDSFRDAVASGDELMQAMWEGQIRAHVGRFDDLRTKWMADPLVQRAVATSDESDLETVA